MDRDRLLLGLAAVFAGLAAALAVAALAVQPFLLLLAIPFGLTAYFMWHQATGRLAARARAREERARRAASDRGPGAGEGPRGGPWTDGDGSTGDGRGRGRGRRTAPTATETLSRPEAYRTLGLAPGADADAVRGAYRERVKEVHPDAETGDEEAFKRVNRAYERLRE